MSSEECDHRHWRGTKCPSCGKELTWKERWNITIQNLNRIKKEGVKPENQQFIEIAEAELKGLGEEYVQ